MTLRAAFILDAARVHHEHAAFARLAVGLAAEGIRTLLALDGDPHHATDDRDAPIPTITVPTRLPAWVRTRAIDATLDAFAEAGMDQLDVVVAAGTGGIGFASRLARRLGRPLVVEVRNRAELRAVPRDPGITVIAATDGLRALAARRLDEDRCTHLPVPVPRTRSLSRGPRNLGVILGPVANLPTWTAMIDGLAGRDQLPGGLEHLAVELGDQRSDGRIWSHLRQRSLLSKVTAFDDADRLRPCWPTPRSCSSPNRASRCEASNDRPCTAGPFPWRSRIPIAPISEPRRMPWCSPPRRRGNRPPGGPRSSRPGPTAWSLPPGRPRSIHSFPESPHDGRRSSRPSFTATRRRSSRPAEHPARAAQAPFGPGEGPKAPSISGIVEPPVGPSRTLRRVADRIRSRRHLQLSFSPLRRRPLISRDRRGDFVFAAMQPRDRVPTPPIADIARGRPSVGHRSRATWTTSATSPPAPSARSTTG